VIVDTERNRSVYLELVELVRSRRAIAFVGSGVTSSLGYPTWRQLIESLAAEVRAAGGEEIQSNGLPITVEQVLRDFKAEPLVQAQIFKQSLGERYFPLMSTLFGPKEKRIAPIADLVSLPFRHLLTSNYDCGLEQHHNPANQPSSICLYHDSAPQFIQNFTDDNYARRIVHVHGRDNEPRRIILTEEDYGAYVQSGVLDTFWQVVPVVGRLVFFGFSFNDTDLLWRFRRVRMAFGTTNQSAARHFAIVPLDDPAKEEQMTIVLKMKYGVEPVFFLQKGTSFAEYDDLLSTLKSDVIGRLPEQLAIEEPPALVVQIGPQPALVELEQAATSAVQEGVESLRRMTRENIMRRQTGDSE
jgi:hypothetical protein